MKPTLLNIYFLDNKDLGFRVFLKNQFSVKEIIFSPTEEDKKEINDFLNNILNKYIGREIND